MLIAISGPSSSGKGTVLYDLESYGYCVVHQQYARTLLKQHGLTVEELYKLPEAEILQFHCDLIQLKSQVESKFITTNYPVFVERSFMDFYVYLQLKLDKEIPEFFEQCLTQTLQYYQQIIILECCPCIEADGVRITTPEFINKQKNLFKTFMSITTLSPLIRLVHQVNRQDRVNSIIQHLQG